jgi:hypothetical protein
MRKYASLSETWPCDECGARLKLHQGRVVLMIAAAVLIVLAVFGLGHLYEADPNWMAAVALVASAPISLIEGVALADDQDDDRGDGLSDRDAR